MKNIFKGIYESQIRNYICWSVYYFFFITQSIYLLIYHHDKLILIFTAVFIFILASFGIVQEHKIYKLTKKYKSLINETISETKKEKS